MDWPKDTHCPSSQVARAPSVTVRRNSSRSRDLPMPASPARDTICPWPRFTCSKRSWRTSSSRARPTSGVRPRSTAASSRARRPRARSTSNACTGARPFTASSPTSRVSKKPAIAAWVASLTRTLPGRALCCRRAARFVVSPTAV